MNRLLRFGQLLRQYRETAQLGRDDVAKQADLTTSYVGLLEQGRRGPSMPVLDRLVEILGIDDAARSRLLIRLALDRLEGEGLDLLPGTLDVVEGVVEALILASTSATDATVDISLPAPEVDELRMKAAEYIASALASATRRWRSTEFLTMRSYFEAITSEMTTPGLEGVQAVNTIDPRRWLEDVREQGYLESHTTARESGVEIHRIFVVGPEVTNETLLAVDQAQSAAGITDVRYVDQTTIDELAERPEDSVRFRLHGDADDEGTLYIGHPDPVDSTRVDFGERLRDSGELRRFSQLFDLLYTSAVTKQDFLASRNADG